MNNVKPFFDTNILVYAFSRGDDPRFEVARILLATGGILGVQTLNEFVTVSRRKLKFDWNEVEEALDAVRSLCRVIVPLTLAMHEAGVRIAKRYGYTLFDSLVIVAALEAGCKTLYSEDMQDGQTIESLTIKNPFTKSLDC